MIIRIKYEKETLCNTIGLNTFNVTAGLCYNTYNLRDFASLMVVFIVCVVGAQTKQMHYTTTPSSL